MQLIDADTAQPGLTILAQEQTRGKGQRGKVWNVEPGESILMSIILSPRRNPDAQFPFLAGVAVAVADVLLELYEHWTVCIKWPNDIIINDKKAGGILIENVLKGGKWSNSVVGLGLNVLQNGFPPDLPQAISLKMASGATFPVKELARRIREQIIRYTSGAFTDGELFERYTSYIYRRTCIQRFLMGDKPFDAIIAGVSHEGLLLLQHEDGHIRKYAHGALTWQW